MKKNISWYLKKRKTVIDKELSSLLVTPKGYLKTIYTAMNYALKGGKRIRPILCLACAEAAGGKAKDALKAACAIEIIHSYSLVHDDLPCMDNDDYRRGRLSCHKKFGIANAVLTGDALLTYAFNILCYATKSPSVNMRLIEVLSHAAGTRGMIGGQAEDIIAGKKNPAMQEYINIRKTGALIAASCKIGAISIKAEKKDIESLFKFGEHIGLVFQIVDDIIDNQGLAKIMSKKHALEYAKSLTLKAKALIAGFGKKAAPLCEIADFVLNRTY
jgi:geranylgeranyl diphosphate synthase type II